MERLGGEGHQELQELQAGEASPGSQDRLNAAGDEAADDAQRLVAASPRAHRVAFAVLTELGQKGHVARALRGLFDLATSSTAPVALLPKLEERLGELQAHRLSTEERKKRSYASASLRRG